MLRPCRTGSPPARPRPRGGRWARNQVYPPSYPAAAAARAPPIIPFAAPVYRIAYHALDMLPLSSFFSTAVQFSSITMIAMVIAVIWIFDPRRRAALPYLLAALLVAGAVNDCIKWMAGRERPEWTVAARGKKAQIPDPEVAEAGTSEALVRPGSRPDHWLLFSSGRLLFSDRFESFPSGHACTAFALAAFLVVLYPSGRVVWLIAAFGCALARVRFRRHFPDDILFGGAVGWAIAGWVFSWRWPGALGARLAAWAGTTHRIRTGHRESTLAGLPRGFTLIELLVVVAVIAILAAVAVPNFLEAQARAKCSRARADLRTVATALESYSADNNGHYPADRPRGDLDGFLAAPALTSPVAYLASLGGVIDPFRRDLDLVPADADEAYRYWNLAGRARESDPIPAAVANGIETEGSWVVSSAGPDRVDQYPTSGDHLYETVLYDATNGTVTRGDIVRSAREAWPR